MKSIERTRYLVELQGYDGLTDRAVLEIAPWLRVAPAATTAWAVAGIVMGSTAALSVLAAIAALGALLPWHPFDVPYNIVLHRWLGTAPIPRSRLPRRFASSVATVWLSGAIAAFGAGSPGFGTLLGVLFAGPALVPVITGVCLPALFLRRVRALAARVKTGAGAAPTRARKPAC